MCTFLLQCFVYRMPVYQYHSSRYLFENLPQLTSSFCKRTDTIRNAMTARRWLMVPAFTLPRSPLLPTVALSSVSFSLLILLFFSIDHDNLCAGDPANSFLPLVRPDRCSGSDVRLTSSNLDCSDIFASCKGVRRHFIGRLRIFWSLT